MHMCPCSWHARSAGQTPRCPPRCPVAPLRSTACRASWWGASCRCATSPASPRAAAPRWRRLCTALSASRTAARCGKCQTLRRPGRRAAARAAAGSMQGSCWAPCWHAADAAVGAAILTRCPPLCAHPCSATAARPGAVAPPTEGSARRWGAGQAGQHARLKPLGRPAAAAAAGPGVVGAAGAPWPRLPVARNGLS